MNPPPPRSPQHWSPDEFRRRGHEAVDFIADYWARLQADAPAWPVRSTRTPGETGAMLPDAAPEQGEAWEAIAADLERIVLPGLTHWQSPSFFAYFPANVSAPSVIGELLSAGLGVQGMLWATSPACTEIETRMLDWMARAAGLPGRFVSTSGEGGRGGGGGVIQGSASDATLVALLAARQRVRTQRASEVGGGRGGGAGAGGAEPPLVAYASTQAHSSVVKAALIAGVARDLVERDGLIGGGPGDGGGAGGVRLLGVDRRFRLRPDLLEAAIIADRARGLAPFYVAATVGTTGCMGVDDLDALAEVCQRQGVWLHVDGAYAGSACVCPEFAWMLHGAGGPGRSALERVDSLCFNPHKALLTNFDCTLFWTADRAALIGALSITPEYLRNAASDAGGVIDYRDWQVPLGRRFRALKLWLVLRSYGLEGLRAHIREHAALGGLFASLVGADARFELAAEPALGLVCFRLRGAGGVRAAGNAASKALLEALNKAGRMFLTHTVLPAGEDGEGGGGGGGGGEGVYVLRMAIGATFTRDTHVRRAWEEIASTATLLLGGGA